MNHLHHSPTAYSHEWRLSGVPPLLTFLPTPILNLFPLLSEHSNPKLDSYLKSRGILPKTYKRFGVRYNEWDELVFSYTSLVGRTIGVVFRNVDTKKISGLKIPALVEDGIELPKKARMGAWFGLHLIDISQPLLIVEGECFPGDASVLTPNGWVELCDYKGEDVLQVNDDMSASYVTPSAYIRKPYKGEMVIREAKGYYSKTTPEHLLVATDYNGNLCKKPAGSHIPQTHHIPRAVILDGTGINLSDDQLRLSIAISADAHIADRKGTGYHKPREKRYATMAFTKQRKINRLIQLLDNLNIVFYLGNWKNGYTAIYFPIPDWVPGRFLPHVWIALSTLRQKEIILEELVLWDGSRVKGRNQTNYCSKYKENVIFVQTIAHTYGRISTLTKNKNQWGEWYKVSILHNKNSNSFQSIHKREEIFDGIVYCVTVPSGMILVKQNDRITVTGNCDAMFAYQCGFTNVISPGGMGPTKAQIKSIPNKVIFLGYDADEAGRSGMEQTTNRLLKRDSNRIIYYIDWNRQGKGKDPSDLKTKENFWSCVYATQGSTHVS